ncbi:MAG: polysaccharide biosynthesis tyrosine autokinase [Eubacteriales bacterium]|nr:polysaccharide biosynthesis tyrosine autokinase [Eubacteriales bacterium]
MAETENRGTETIDQEQIDVTHLLAKAWKQFGKSWWLLLLLLALSVGAELGYQHFFHVDEYEAYASFSISVGSTSSGMTNYNTSVSLTRLGETFPYILESGALKTVVREKLGMSYLPVSISAKVVSDTSLFRIGVRGRDAEICTRVLDAVIENYPQVARYVIGKTTLTMLDYSGVPSSPVNGVSRRALIMRGLEIGGLVYLALLAALIVTRRTVESEEDLKRYTSLRCLATIPRTFIKRRSGKKQPKLLVNQKSVSQAFVEAVNLLRIRVLREMDRREAKVLVLTSAGELEGKSTIAANLALSCAQKGFRVLLIDGDLRHPSIAARFGLEAKRGVVDVLTGRAELEEAIQHYRNGTLDILPGSGAVKAAQVPQLLGRVEMGELIAYGRKQYDYVFIDSPPCGMMQDALMLAAHSDATVLVIRQDFLARSRILEVLDLLADTNVGILGCVINGEEGSVGSYGYGRYGYGSGYGKYGAYGKYGYGSKYTKKPG